VFSFLIPPWQGGKFYDVADVAPQTPTQTLNKSLDSQSLDCCICGNTTSSKGSVWGEAASH
jgi:hypothetical protein